MNRGKPGQRLSFTAKLEKIAQGMEYYAVTAKITQTLSTRAAVPVSARVNGSKPFLVSLHPNGTGGHGMRVRNQIRLEVGAKKGDRVKVDFTVIDQAKTVIPKDVEKVLKAEGALKDFQAIPDGERNFLLRVIDQAAKPDTRAKRIEAALEAAHKRREKLADRS